ncbi:MAG: transcriptional regulator [Rubrobacteraceae bacterium]
MDTLICQPKRLAILAALDERGSSSFSELHELTGITTGNLSSHVRRLEDHGLVSVKKDFVDRKPRTTVTLESTGRQAITDYLQGIASIVDQWRNRQHVLLSVSRRP